MKLILRLMFILVAASVLFAIAQDVNAEEVPEWVGFDQGSGGSADTGVLISTEDVPQVQEDSEEVKFAPNHWLFDKKTVILPPPSQEDVDIIAQKDISIDVKEDINADIQKVDSEVENEKPLEEFFQAFVDFFRIFVPSFWEG